MTQGDRVKTKDGLLSGLFLSIQVLKIQGKPAKRLVLFSNSKNRLVAVEAEEVILEKDYSCPEVLGPVLRPADTPKDSSGLQESWEI